jgi:SAM-dependent methyltransferase
VLIHDFLESVVHGLRYHEVLRVFRNGGTLADLGSGDEPRFLRRVSQRVDRAWGLDPRAKPGQEGNITLLRGDATQRLPFEDASLDQLTSLAVIEHVDDPHAILAECLRVMRPGGQLIITTPSRLGILVHELMRRVGLIRDVKEGEHRDFLMSPERLSGWVSAAGFRVTRSAYLAPGLNILCVGVKP